MKQDTDCLIETLRLKEAEALFYKPAADRLEELQQALSKAVKQRDKALALNKKLKSELNYAFFDLRQLRIAAAKDVK